MADSPPLSTLPEGLLAGQPSGAAKGVSRRQGHLNCSRPRPRKVGAKMTMSPSVRAAKVRPHIRSPGARR